MKQSILFLLFFTIIGNTLQAQSLNQTEDSLNKSGILEATYEIPAADYLNEKENTIKEGLRKVMVSKWTKIN